MSYALYVRDVLYALYVVYALKGLAATVLPLLALFVWLVFHTYEYGVHIA